MRSRVDPAATGASAQRPARSVTAVAPAAEPMAEPTIRRPAEIQRSAGADWDVPVPSRVDTTPSMDGSVCGSAAVARPGGRPELRIQSVEAAGSHATVMDIPAPMRNPFACGRPLLIAASICSATASTDPEGYERGAESACRRTGTSCVRTIRDRRPMSRAGLFRPARWRPNVRVGARHAGLGDYRRSYGAVRRFPQA